MRSVKLNKNSLKFIDISDEEYFGQDYKRYLSSSRIKLIDSSIDDLLNNNSGFKSSSLSMGSVIHQALLEGKSIDSICRTYPGLGPKYQALGLECVKYFNNGDISDEDLKTAAAVVETKISRDKFESVVKQYVLDIISGDNRIIVSNSIYQKIVACVENGKKLKLRSGEKQSEVITENAIFCEFDICDDDVNVDKLFFKIKIDRLEIDHKNKIIYVDDLKTTQSTYNDFIQNSFYYFKYHRQIAIYTYIASAYFKKIYPDYVVKSNIYIISTRTFECNKMTVNQQIIDRGMDDMKDIFAKIAKYKLDNPSDIRI